VSSKRDSPGPSVCDAVTGSGSTAPTGTDLTAGSGAAADGRAANAGGAPTNETTNDITTNRTHPNVARDPRRHTNPRPPATPARTNTPTSPNNDTQESPWRPAADNAYIVARTFH